MVFKNEHNPTFSIIKGIAIISVVIGHCVNSSFWEIFVNQYHLAVFFFIAGYFFKEKYLAAPKNYLIKKIKRLYIPFVCAGIGCALLHNALHNMYIYSNVLTATDILKELFHVTVRMVSHETLMGAMWFCPAMLIVSLISWGAFKTASLLKNNLSKQVNPILVFSVLIGIASICLYAVHLESPYCIWQYMIICGIFYEGFLFSKCEKKINRGGGRNMQLLYAILFTVLLILLLWLTSIGIYGRLQPANVNVENPITILLIAAMGALMVYCLSHLISNSKIGNWIAICGDYSFSIMLLHFLAFKAVNLLQCLMYDYPLERIAEFPCINYLSMEWMGLYILAGCTLPIALSKLYEMILLHVFNIFKRNK